MATISTTAQVLEAKRLSIEGAIHRISMELADCYPENRSELQRSLYQLRFILDRITYALKREAEGCVGVCEDCGEPIDSARLEVVPWATRCVTCESRGDRRRHVSAKP